jgi:putative ABC transport system substrate-binding protein
MRRREFIAGLGAAASPAIWPLAAQAQQRPAVPVIGYLAAGLPEVTANNTAAFRKGLSEMGYVEGLNLAIEYRWAQNDRQRLPELAADLVRRRVAIIVATPNAAALAAKAATETIPIVFSMSADPVQAGLVTSLNRPGGNATGTTDMAIELETKRIGLLHALLPSAARFAVLVHPANPSVEFLIREARMAGAAIGRQIEILYAGANREIDTAFASLVQKRADALLVSPDILFNARRSQILTLAARHAVPVIYPNREDADAGGLMSYGTSVIARQRQLGLYAGRVLKGEKPADLPIIRATKFEFIINLQTARTLGLEVPPTLLALADEVIE